MFSLKNKNKSSLNYPKYPSYLELCQIMLTLFQMAKILPTILVILLIKNSEEAYSSMRCVIACGDTMYPQNARVCRSCVSNPPINYQMCRFACDYTLSPNLKSICGKCVTRVELSDELYIHACRYTTAFDQYRRICTVRIALNMTCASQRKRVTNACKTR